MSSERDTGSAFSIEVNDDVTLSRDDTVQHADHGPMVVDQVTVSALGKRARLESQMREDRMSIQLSEEDLKEAWGETIASDPFELRDGDTVTHSKEFSSKDDEIEVSIKVSGPEDDADPVMAHLHDQTVRVLQGLENGQAPSESEGVYKIDWDAILNEEDTEDEP